MATLVAGTLVVTPSGYTWTSANGYFYQVSALHGKVVGVNAGDWRHPFRWPRRHAIRRNVKLTLYEYRWPVKDLHELPIVKVVRTDERGGFDFGPQRMGHYRLEIADPGGGESLFDVEIVYQSKPTETVVIDISPNYPDCTGGHEFTAIVP